MEVFFFFFQAEDGIRDPLWSGGLGDVYKRQPEWGAMLGDALELIYVAPWTVMLPGAAIMISVLLVNLLGDGVRRAIIAGVE